MPTATYSITGMTCQHCVNAVSAELGKLPGVQSVTVDLEGGTATVTSDQPLESAQVQSAVDEAGYQMGG